MVSTSVIKEGVRSARTRRRCVADLFALLTKFCRQQKETMRVRVRGLGVFWVAASWVGCAGEAFSVLYKTWMRRYPASAAGAQPCPPRSERSAGVAARPD